MIKLEFLATQYSTPSTVQYSEVQAPLSYGLSPARSVSSSCALCLPGFLPVMSFTRPLVSSSLSDSPSAARICRRARPSMERDGVVCGEAREPAGGLVTAGDGWRERRAAAAAVVAAETAYCSGTCKEAHASNNIQSSNCTESHSNQYYCPYPKSIRMHKGYEPSQHEHLRRHGSLPGTMCESCVRAIHPHQVQQHPWPLVHSQQRAASSAVCSLLQPERAFHGTLTADPRDHSEAWPAGKTEYRRDTVTVHASTCIGVPVAAGQ